MKFILPLICAFASSCTYVGNRGLLRSLPGKAPAETNRIEFSGVYWSPDSFQVETNCVDKRVRFVWAMMFREDGYVYVFDPVFPETDISKSEDCVYSDLNTHERCLSELDDKINGYFHSHRDRISGWGKYSLTEDGSLTVVYGKRAGSLAPIPPMNLFGFTKKTLRLGNDSTIIEDGKRVYSFHGFTSNVDSEIKPLDKGVFKHWWIPPILWGLGI